MRRRALRERDVQLIVGAVGISALGDFVLWIPLALRLDELHASGVVVAALLVCLWAPVVLLAPAAGLVVDRFETRRVLVVASCLQVAAAGGMLFALDSVAAILVLAAVLGIGFAFAQPAEFALLPVIARGERLGEINSYVESARCVGMTAGPLIGGVLAAAGSTAAAMLVNAATFAAVALAGLALKARREPASTRGRGDRARHGLVHLYNDGTLRLVVGVVVVSLLFMTATMTAQVFFLKDELGVGDAAYGLIVSCWTAAMVAGAVLVARRVPAPFVAGAALVAVATQGAGIALPALWLAASFCGLMWAVGGLGHGAKNVLVRTLIAERVPERLHGRAFAAYNGARNGAELVAVAAGGLLVASIGSCTTLLLAGGIPVLAASVGLLRYRRSRVERSCLAPDPARA